MGKIVSFHSYRGGTGKSNLTANSAVTVAVEGLRVGIVDTDIQSPGIHVLFGLDESKINRSLNDYLWGKCAIEDTVYSITPAAVSAKKGTIFLIPASIKAGEIARVLREGYDVGLLNDGFQNLLDQLKLDFLFIDTHPGLNEETLLSIAISDLVVLILRPDQQDFQGTAVTVEVARKLNVQKMVLALNKVIARMDQESLRRQLETAYKVPVAAIFPLTEDMIQLGSRGLFCLEYPNHPFTQKLKELVGHILA